MRWLGMEVAVVEGVTEAVVEDVVEAAAEVTVVPIQHLWAAVVVGRKLPIPGASVHSSIRHSPRLVVLRYLHLGVRGMGGFPVEFSVASELLAGILDLELLLFRNCILVS